MKTQVFELDYCHNQKKCTLAVEYGVNTGPVTSGFEIVRDLVPDLRICIGYPTMHAFVKEHEGYGFCRYCGFIQVALLETEDQTEQFADVPPIMQEKGIPFAACGYPAELYDAPVNNYVRDKAVLLTFHTYLVDMPSFVNGNHITFLTGFQWGYREDGGRIELLAFDPMDIAAWRLDSVFLAREFSAWNFA